MWTVIDRIYFSVTALLADLLLISLLEEKNQWGSEIMGERILKLTPVVGCYSNWHFGKDR